MGLGALGSRVGCGQGSEVGWVRLGAWAQGLGHVGSGAQGLGCVGSGHMEARPAQEMGARGLRVEAWGLEIHGLSGAPRVEGEHLQGSECGLGALSSGVGACGLGAVGSGAQGTWARSGSGDGCVGSGAWGCSRCMGSGFESQACGSRAQRAQVRARGLRGSGVGRLGVRRVGSGARGSGVRCVEARGVGSRECVGAGLWAQGLGPLVSGAQGLGSARRWGLRGLGVQGTWAHGLGVWDQGRGLRGSQAQGVGHVDSGGSGLRGIRV